MRRIVLTSLFLAGVMAACADETYEDAVLVTHDTWPYFKPEPVVARAPWERRIPMSEVFEQIKRSFYATLPPAQHLSPAKLRAAITDAMNIGYLLDGFETRPFIAIPVSTEDHATYVWHRVILGDELLLALTVDYVVPKGPTARHPAVVSLHGHFGDGPKSLRSFLGVELAARGFVVAAPTFRHMDCGDDERDQALVLMRDGFTLLGQRVYESLLVMKFLRSLDTVDPARIGVMAHSGGSSTANVLVRVTDWPAAVVTDYDVEFRSLCGGQVHCETIPAMLPLAADVNDQDTLAIPHLRVGYGYRKAADRAQVLSLFETTLIRR